MWRVACAAVLCALLAGCFNTASFAPNRSPVPDASANLEVLAVLPFSGYALGREASEWFAHKLQMSPRYRVISPGAAEARLASEAGLGQRPIDVAEAKRLGALLGARLVVFGRIASSSTTEIEIILIDVSRGELLRHTSSPRSMETVVTGHYPTTVYAVEEAAQWLLAEMEAGDLRRAAAAEIKR